MACGPVWYTDVYGFDYATAGEGEEVPGDGRGAAESGAAPGGGPGA